MAYGILKCDTVTFTDGGVDKSVSISGLVQNPTFSGNITVTGTVSGNTIQGQTVSGVTVTGTTALFSTGTFISLTGTTSQGTTATYTSGSFTSLTGVTTSGTTANFVSGVFSTQISGATVTGNAGAFTTLTGGVTTITSGVFAAGSATNPSISFSSDTNTGIYSPGADQVAISTNGTGRLFVDASGNVGVGASSPTRALDVNGSIQLPSNNALYINGSNNYLYADSTATELASATLIKFVANGSERLRITSAGLVGIGTSAPNGSLVVRNGNSETEQIIFGSNLNTGGRDWRIGRDNAATADLIIKNSDATNSNATTERLRITEAGLVGIGTSAPGQNITVQSSASGTAPTFKLQNPIDSNSSQGAANNLSAGQLLFGATGSYPLTAKIESVYNADASFGRSAKLIFSGANGSGTLTERLTIDESGRVGIGTSSPGSKLHIAGGATVVSIGSNDAGDTGAAIFYGTGTKYNWKIGAQQNVDNGFEITPSTAAGGTTFTTPALAVNPSGQVGIGTTSPSTTLEVNGGCQITGSASGFSGGEVRLGATTADLQHGISTQSTGNPILFFDHRGTGNTGIFAWRVGTNGASERMRIDSSGRLLVGTSSARTNLPFAFGSNAARFQVEGAAEGQGAFAVIQNYDSATTSVPAVFNLARSGATSIGSNTIVASGNRLGEVQFSGSDGTNFIQAAVIRGEVDGTPGANDMPGRLVFSTTADGASSPTERMRITSGGEIQFGNTTNGAYTVTRNPGICAYFDRRTSDGVVISFERQGSEVGNISVTTTATAYNTSSDYRLKENVTPVADGITRLQQLKPSRFNFIADPDKTVDGFIAHEVQTIVPEAITGEKDAVDDDGNPQYQGIDQSKLVPLLTAALQEAIAKIETLEARLTAAGL